MARGGDGISALRGKAEGSGGAINFPNTVENPPAATFSS
jgi:hypothetical protein